MDAALLIDFGSTRTKLAAVDLDAGALLGTASAATTVGSDIGEGLNTALEQLYRHTGQLHFGRRLACSSAAGGLRMVCCGLVPSLTAAAAKAASLGAGAKLAATYAYQLTEEDIAEIDALRPDILLLCGGTDGGNTAYILHNAGMLATCKTEFPIILAGNRSCAAACEKKLAGRELYRCENVMPAFGVLNTAPVQAVIRQLFLKRIVQARGLSRAADLLDDIVLPTPAAMMQAMELLQKGAGPAQPGLGELMGVDLGGATTDVYSVATGAPQNDSTIVKGLPEPYAKRTVEGNIGMRYSAPGVLEEAGADALAALAGVLPGEAEAYVQKVTENPAHLPKNDTEQRMDYALAHSAVRIACTRHAGTLEEVYTPNGPAFAQTGKDLRRVETLVLTGGAVIHGGYAAEIAPAALYSPAQPFSLRPKKARVYVDEQYILPAMGLLGQKYPQIALHLMTKELACYGTCQQTPD